MVMTDQIESFKNYVGTYIYYEYPDFWAMFDKTDCFDFIGSYYMGGNSVPDTARYVVELLLMRINGQA